MRDYKANELWPHTKVLSSSQFLLYLASPERFGVEYKDGLPRSEGHALRLGRGFSEAFADRQFDLRAYAKAEKLRMPEVERLIAALPLLAHAERCEEELFADVGRGWKLRATLDGYNPSRWEIIENKIGAEPNDYTRRMGIPMGWTQERVNFDNQLTFQAFVHWKAITVQPSRIVLNWIPTTKSKTMVHRFKTSRSIAKLKQFGDLVAVVIENIEAGNFSRPIA